MNELLIYVWLASTITIAANEFKVFFQSSIELIFPSLSVVNWGLFASMIFSFWAIFSYETGLLFNIGIEYGNIYFKYFDLTVTSLIIAGGAGIVYDWIEAIKSSKKQAQQVSSPKEK